MNRKFPEKNLPKRDTVSKFLNKYLVFLPINVTMLLILVIWIINESFAVPDTVIRSLFLLVLLTLIGTAVLYIWRKEVPGPIPGSIIRGKLAIIIGVVELVAFVFVGLFFIFYQR